MPVNILHCLVITYAHFLVLGGCVETDGPPAQQHDPIKRLCTKGYPDRKAVPPAVLKGFLSCCDGSAHLIPAHLIPLDFHSRLEPGPSHTNSLCVPDEIASNAAYSPRLCTSVFNLKGACLSTCLPEVRDVNFDLPQDICSPNQRCAPCRDPVTWKSTGACDLGELACMELEDECSTLEPTIDVTQYPSCCPEGRAHCIDEEFVPPADQGDLGRCADGMSLCVPDEFIARGNRYQPPSCASINGAEGRCLSICSKQIAAQKDLLPVATCNPDERCAPCYDPRTGVGTGACTKGPCDRAKDPPTKFTPCGESQTDAFCVPTTLIPKKFLDHFDTRGCKATCAENERCVPKAFLDGGDKVSLQKCSNPLTGFLGSFQAFFKNPLKALQALQEYSEGRCASRCLPQVRGQADLLGQHGCPPHEVCVPCYDPTKLSQGKVTTGVCDF